MSYTLTVTQEADYLQIKAAGTSTLQSLQSLARDCVAACEQHKCTRFLLDMEQMTGRLSIVDIHEFVTKHVPPLGHGLPLKAAIILNLQVDSGHREFLENVAVNTGVNLRVFTSGSMALEWLRGSNTSDRG